MEGLPLHLIYSFVFTILMSFLPPSSLACTEVLTCGNQSFKYPFGAKNSGCGDPALQLECDPQVNMSLINISGHQFYVIYYDCRHWKDTHHIVIVDKNMWGDTCDPLKGKHTVELWSNPQFHISEENVNVSLWGDCSEDVMESLPLGTELFALGCNKTWYYSNIDLVKHCKSLVQLPVQNKFPFTSVGFKIEWSPSKGCEHCESEKKLCIYNVTNPTHLSCKSPAGDSVDKTAIAIGFSLGGVAVVAAQVVLCIFIVKRRKRARSGGRYGDYSNYRRCMIGGLTIFPYQELQQATNLFDEKNELGGGGFGVVYLGELHDGRFVAVKKLYQDTSRSVEKYLNEVQILSSLCHPNLVRLYGCTSPQSPMLLLVYEFVANGTLSDHLHGCRRTLTGLPWVIRLNIAVETAQALAYLHSMNPPIFHRDVKSSNILLDEHFRAKVADFGLSRLVPLNVSHVTTAPQGTPGYVDPEYHKCFQLTDKSDVYSFGVVLVEIISAKVAVDTMRSREEISLANMATEKIRRGILDELVDPDLKTEINYEVKVTVSAVAEVAFECLAIEKDCRPTMREVVARLMTIKEMLEESTDSSNSIATTPPSSLTEANQNESGIGSN